MRVLCPKPDRFPKALLLERFELYKEVWFALDLDTGRTVVLGTAIAPERDIGFVYKKKNVECYLKLVNERYLICFSSYDIDTDKFLVYQFTKRGLDEGYPTSEQIKTQQCELSLFTLHAYRHKVSSLNKNIA